eukprot:1028007-Rhodomonas_salina.2
MGGRAVPVRGWMPRGGTESAGLRPPPPISAPARTAQRISAAQPILAPPCKTESRGGGKRK